MAKDTYLEMTLKMYCARTGMVLYRYYNDNEARDPGIPDILDDLYDKRDAVQDAINKRKLKNARSNTYRNCYSLEASIDEINRTIGRIIDDSDSTYFVMSPADFNITYSTNYVYPIVESSEKLWKIVADFDRRARWESIDKEVRVVTRQNFDGTVYDVISYESSAGEEKVRLVDDIFKNGNASSAGLFLRADEYYTESGDTVRVRTGTTCEVYVCKDCGDLFLLTPGEIASYKRKGLSIPKRCTLCRVNRSAESRMLKELINDGC